MFMKNSPYILYINEKASYIGISLEEIKLLALPESLLSCAYVDDKYMYINADYEDAILDIASAVGRVFNLSVHKVADLSFLDKSVPYEIQPLKAELDKTTQMNYKILEMFNAKTHKEDYQDYFYNTFEAIKIDISNITQSKKVFDVGLSKNIDDYKDFVIKYINDNLKELLKNKNFKKLLSKMAYNKDSKKLIQQVEPDYNFNNDNLMVERFMAVSMLSAMKTYLALTKKDLDIINVWDEKNENFKQTYLEFSARFIDIVDKISAVSGLSSDKEKIKHLEDIKDDLNSAIEYCEKTTLNIKQNNFAYYNRLSSEGKLYKDFQNQIMPSNKNEYADISESIKGIVSSVNEQIKEFKKPKLTI